MRRKWVFIDGELTEVSPDYRGRSRNRQFDQLNDDMSAKSMVDGKHYTSKAKYRAEVNAHGYRELGNDVGEYKKPEPKSYAADLHKAWSELS